MKNELRIENGKVYGFTVDLSFGSQGPTGSKRTVSAKWNFDGMTTEEFCKLAWANFKVRVQSTTLASMKDADVDSLKGKTLHAKDYLVAQSGGLAAKVSELQEKLDATMKAFMTVAMNEAISELGPDAGNEALGNRGMEIYREKYEALVK